MNSVWCSVCRVHHQIRQWFEQILRHQFVWSSNNLKSFKKFKFNLVFRRFRSKCFLYFIPFLLLFHFRVIYFATGHMFIYFNLFRFRFTTGSRLTFIFLDQWMIAKRENFFSWSDLSPMGWIAGSIPNICILQIFIFLVQPILSIKSTPRDLLASCVTQYPNRELFQISIKFNEKCWESVIEIGSKYYCLTVIYLFACSTQFVLEWLELFFNFFD